MSNYHPAHQAIINRIAQSPQGRIPYSETMDLNLHGPGFYDSGEVKIGLTEDSAFHTMPELSPVFGAAIGNLVAHAWHRLGRPSDFTLLEGGPGNGTLLRDILDRWQQIEPRLYEQARVIALDESPALAERQHSALLGRPVDWICGDIRALPLRGLHGVILTNEVFDTLGANRLVRIGEDVFEVYTTLNENNYPADAFGPPSLETLSMPDARFVKPLIEKAINVGVPHTLQGFAHALERGYVITIDYGGLDGELAQHHNFRTYGTIHGVDGQIIPVRHGPLSYANYFPGRLDITHDVNFSSLQVHGQTTGLEALLYKTQAAVLRQFGFEAIRAAMDLTPPQGSLAESLIAEPYGTSFKVLIQGKGVDSPPPGREFA